MSAGRHSDRSSYGYHPGGADNAAADDDAKGEDDVCHCSRDGNIIY